MYLVLNGISLATAIGKRAFRYLIAVLSPSATLSNSFPDDR